MRKWSFLFFLLNIITIPCGVITALPGEKNPDEYLMLPDFYFSSQYRPEGELVQVNLPLKRAGNLILVEAIIDSMPGNLILDTGSSAIVLNSIYFRDNKRGVSVQSGGITGAAAATTNARISNLQISELQYNNLPCNFADLGHLERARNVKILGFFGLSMFSDYEVVLDLNNNLLELHPINTRGVRKLADSRDIRFDVVVPARVEGNIMFIDAVINRRRLTFCLDTGAESNVLSSTLSDNVLGTVDISRRSTLKGAGSADVEVFYGMMNDFSIDKQQVTGMNAIITSLNTMNKYFGVRIDGMLGVDFLEKGIFYINLKRQNLGIVFNKE